MTGGSFADRSSICLDLVAPDLIVPGGCYQVICYRAEVKAADTVLGRLAKLDILVWVVVASGCCSRPHDVAKGLAKGGHDGQLQNCWP